MFEHGRIILNDEGANQRNSWQSEFKDELIMFPTKDVHDDLVDGLSLINQMAVTSYNRDEDDYAEEVLDVVVGF
jgi:phage terminase large subunit-like protein